MSYRLLIKPGAERDLQEVISWYEEKRSGLGVEFLDEVDRKMSMILNNPNQYQVRFKSTRFAILKRFPFAVHFAIERNTIVVFAVLSTYRDPDNWK